MRRVVAAGSARFCGRCDGGLPLVLVSDGPTSFAWECVGCGHRFTFTREQPPQPEPLRLRKRRVTYSLEHKRPERVRELARPSMPNPKPTREQLAARSRAARERWSWHALANAERNERSHHLRYPGAWLGGAVRFVGPPEVLEAALREAST